MDKVVYECGELRAEPANRRLTRAGSDVALEPKAFAVLLLLLERSGALVTREELLDAVWAHRYVTPATLNRVMAMLRRVFGDVLRVPVSQREVRATFSPPAIARLPARLEHLIGREQQLVQLSRLLDRHRAVTVVEWLERLRHE